MTQISSQSAFSESTQPQTAETPHFFYRNGLLKPRGTDAIGVLSDISELRIKADERHTDCFKTLVVTSDGQHFLTHESVLETAGFLRQEGCKATRISGFKLQQLQLHHEMTPDQDLVL